MWDPWLTSGLTTNRRDDPLPHWTIHRLLYTAVGFQVIYVRYGRINLTDQKKEVSFRPLLYQEAFCVVVYSVSFFFLLLFFDVYFAMRAQWKPSHPK